MATPNGAVEFEAGGKVKILRYGINALCRLEDRLGITVTDLGKKMGTGLDVRTLRTVFACGLDGNLSDDVAGDIMDAVGVQRAGQLVGEAFQAAFPAEAAGAKKNPRRAAAGTGSSS